MEQQHIYNEDQWIKTIFLLSDIHGWLQEAEKSLFYQLPIGCKKKLLRNSYYLSCQAVAHILERHYYKISRYPNCGKFTVPVTDILTYIKEAACQPPTPLLNSVYVKRTLEVASIIGFDKLNKPANTITILTNTGGKIITAFPGIL
ncbi:hypothetical protein ABDK00_010945 [Niabella insulamsoli]|uniref:hypothetical protein n=1 Tax=Niabella insulamsoli TaxID=3144874 RepID=UPI0031FDC0C4